MQVPELETENLKIRVLGLGSGPSRGGEVVASYQVEEHQLEIKLKIPPDWPLKRIEVVDGKRVGVDEARWRMWLLRLW